MTLTWRRPTGQPSWPHILAAGVPKSGKTWLAAELSGADDIVGQTAFIIFGERSADEYAQIPGSNYQMLEPSTRHELREAVRMAVDLPRVDERPNLIVLDSATPLWDLLTTEVNATGHARAKAKAERAKRDIDPDDADKAPDLWNIAKERWNSVMDPLMQYDGLVIITARLEDQIEMQGGKPSGRRLWKVIGHKSLPYAVDAVLEFRTAWGPRQKRAVTGVKSFAWQQPDADEEIVDATFGVRDLLDRMGVSLETVGPRHVSVVVATGDDGAARVEKVNPGAQEQWEGVVVAAVGMANRAAGKAKLTELWRSTEEGSARRAAVKAGIDAWTQAEGAAQTPVPAPTPAAERLPEGAPGEDAPVEPVGQEEPAPEESTGAPGPLTVASWKTQIDAIVANGRPKALTALYWRAKEAKVGQDVIDLLTRAKGVMDAEAAEHEAGAMQFDDGVESSGSPEPAVGQQPADPPKSIGEAAAEAQREWLAANRTAAVVHEQALWRAKFNKAVKDNKPRAIEAVEKDAEKQMDAHPGVGWEDMAAEAMQALMAADGAQ